MHDGAFSPFFCKSMRVSSIVDRRVNTYCLAPAYPAQQSGGATRSL